MRQCRDHSIETFAHYRSGLVAIQDYGCWIGGGQARIPEASSAAWQFKRMRRQTLSTIGPFLVHEVEKAVSSRCEAKRSSKLTRIIKARFLKMPVADRGTGTRFSYSKSVRGYFLRTEKRIGTSAR